MRVIVAGALANKPKQGGEAWVRLSWALGLRELGCDVHFAEQCATGADYFMEVTQRFGLEATLIGVHDTRRLVEFAKDADLLVNISGHLDFGPVFERVKRRVFVDIDPGYTQFWHASGNAGARLAGHDVYFTIGENIGSPDCAIPDCGLCWHKIVPPVVLSQWPSFPSSFTRFTTVANWRGAFGGIKYDGVTYGQKAHEFRKLMALPQRVRAGFEIALGIHPGDAGDIEALRTNGWHLSDPHAASASPDLFREYVRASGAEFSCAQGVYVQTKSGWFSDRTAHYLASGKPALVQNTAFKLSTGDGLLAFDTMDEAAAGAEDILANYSHHCIAARALAEERFDSRKVLAHFLEVTTNSNNA